MIYTGNIRKMRTELDSEGNVSYQMVLYDNLDPGVEVSLNEFIGKEIELKFEDQINCVVTGKKINKVFGEGMSWDAFRNSPLAVESIIRPELSQAHLGIGIRDLEWEIAHHVTPHCTYLSLTSGIKVGVTRQTQIPTRWIDQGAVEAILLAETPYRQAAGLIEVALKDHLNDKTNWRNMLKNVFDTDESLVDVKRKVTDYIPEELKEFISPNDGVTKIHYPVIQYPDKVKSMKLEKEGSITKRLLGIKGQYLLFENDYVINVRSHSGYKISLSLS
jgi:hypothetical protein